ncbi:RrF2 family transcriptional regulator [Denitrobacterium detoxificans]|uniref:Transcriptional regulator, BadM/Rrf2 family n=1 Tax=Denitrobacterium detoxificans TaxID=79604 RepID=A0A1H8UAB7_9ACTN|nr:Rrf2 family transcriptional regulator [Denitrobacterium detoxificans]SEO99987.1 transcriptional regulator, BadM/Rrf2 family [Denitrobacterium detoxificans]
MELTRRCDYACRILRAAYNHRDQYVSIAEIAEEEDIPYAFARTIQHDLAKAGYVHTTRGSRGGLKLALDPNKVTILDVLCALQGPVTISNCAADPETCTRSGRCAFNKVWQAADEVLNALFASITLQQVFDGGTKDDFLRYVHANVANAVGLDLKALAADGVKQPEDFMGIRSLAEDQMAHPGKFSNN